MPNTSDYGDSDDEALLIAANQNGEGGSGDAFAESPRLTKRRRTERDVQGTRSRDDEQDDDDDADLEREIDGANGEAEEDNAENQKRKHLLHEPRVVAPLDRVILTQTQIAPASQPWEIRGPIWKRPKPKEAAKTNGITDHFAPANQQRPLPIAVPAADKSIAQIIQTQKTIPPVPLFNEPR